MSRSGIRSSHELGPRPLTTKARPTSHAKSVEPSILSGQISSVVSQLPKCVFIKSKACRRPRIPSLTEHDLGCEVQPKKKQNSAKCNGDRGCPLLVPLKRQ